MANRSAKLQTENSFSDACALDTGLGGRCNAAFETETEAESGVSLLMPTLEGYPGGGVCFELRRRRRRRRGAAQKKGVKNEFIKMEPLKVGDGNAVKEGRPAAAGMYSARAQDGSQEMDRN